MSNPGFHFKQFSVHHDLCAMKVGTDGVLLGAWAPCETTAKVLDIGTGSGLIALMLAQRSQAEITAIDIDEGAIRQAEINFGASPWSSRLRVVRVSLQEFSLQSTGKFDLIVSNPPYFINALKSGQTSRDYARHADTLPLETLLHCTAQLLSPSGKASFVFPADSANQLEDIAWEKDLHLTHRMDVSNNEGGKPKRVLMTFGFSRTPIMRTQLALREANNKYTDAFKALCGKFYLDLK
ncbi:MAG: methyltransferase [Bacteroidales bacterium]|jgi:tRNA1Val (adenine37-N6)-methyltransferase|nr:methyltransferase [Bacteroidales bacterium]MDD3161660.1 methyltransferase [Bacteroidales bacterium]